MKKRFVSDGDIFAYHCAGVTTHMDDRSILNIGAVTDDDLFYIRPQHRLVPDTNIIT